MNTPDGFRTTRLRLRPLALLLASLAPAAVAQTPAAQEARPAAFAGWDATLARGKTRQIAFSTTEGTSMSVDISPDSQWIAFDLLGHIYRVAASGGNAVSLTQGSGVALNFHPRISPDGRQVAFISDRDGQDNLWVMNADGSRPRQVTRTLNARYVEPAWAPDGRSIVVVRRDPTAVGFYRTRDSIWRYDVADGAEAAVATEPNGQLHWPSLSGDGRQLYFHESGATGRLHRLRRLDLASGHIADITPVKPESWVYDYRPLGEFAPQISPDGRYLAFARKISRGLVEFRGHEFGPRTALWLRDLTDGTERIIVDPLDLDQADAHVPHQDRVMPGYAWQSDGKGLYFSQGGKLRRVAIDSGQITTIPFRAEVRRTISEQARGDFAAGGATFTARALRWPASSPDGRTLVFEAVGMLWRAAIAPGGAIGAPTRLTDWPAGGADRDSEVFERTPEWSPDGKWVVFTSWRQKDGGGQVWKVPAAGGSPVRVSRSVGDYLHPHWLADGRIAVSKWDPAIERTPLGQGWTVEWLTPAGAVAKAVETGTLADGGTIGNDVLALRLAGTRETDQPIGQDRTPQDARGELLRFGADGGRPVAVVKIAGTPTRVVWAPDGRHAAFERHGEIFLWTGSASAGDTIQASVESGLIVKLSRAGGTNPRWRRADVLEWFSANDYQTYSVSGARGTAHRVTLSVPTDRPKQKLALVGARIVTLASPGVIARGDIVVTDDRITCVGACSTAGAKVIDVAGATIIPAWADVHAHHLGDIDPTIPAKHAASARFLAYGVTTVHDPCGDARVEAYALAEMIKAGRIVGPRSYTTGDCVRTWGGAGDIDSLADAENHVARRLKAGTLSIKSYAVATRIQRQWLIDAGRRQGAVMTAEGQGLLFNLALVMDGTTGWEHWLQRLPVYSDVTQFLGAAKVFWSPQIYRGGFFPHQPGVEYWLGRADLAKDEKVWALSEWQPLAMRQRSGKFDLSAFAFPMMAEAAIDVQQAGGMAAVGGHSEVEGLDSHWEVWSLGMAGKPAEALTAASVGGTNFLGLGKDLGRITPGRLADLIVLDADPLDDITNTRRIRYVMKGGRLFDVSSLAEVAPTQRPYGARPWQNADAARSDTRSLVEPAR